jgi:hypothetical protein
MDVWCVYAFILCLCCPGRGLATSWSLVQGVLPCVKWSWNWKTEARAQGGCRASEKKNVLEFDIFLIIHIAYRKKQFWVCHMLSHNILKAYCKHSLLVNVNGLKRKHGFN